MAKSQGFPWHMAFFIGAAAATVYWLLLKDQRYPGVSLWEGLGFPYGPAGNLTTIGNDFFSGGNQPDGKNAMPVTISPTSMLTDLEGNPLLDMAGNILFDLRGPINVFPSRNAAGLNDSYDPSGSRPS